MKFYTYIYFLLIFSYVIFGCAPLNPNIIPITDPNKPVERAAFSILPPNEGKWYLTKCPDFDVAFGRMKSKTHTLGATVGITIIDREFTSPEDFLVYIKEETSISFDNNRFSDLNHSVNLTQRFSEFSAKMLTTYKDDGVPYIAKGEYLQMKMYGYTFIHPHSPKLIITVSYHERGKPNEISPTFEERAEKFISGFAPKELQVESFLDFAYSLMNSNEPSMAKIMIKEGLIKAQGQNDKFWMAETHHTFGNFYKRPWKLNTFTDYEKSENHLMKAIELYKDMGLYDGVTKSYFTLGSTFRAKGDKERSCRYYGESDLAYKEALKRNQNADRYIWNPNFDNFSDMIKGFKDKFCK